MLTYDELTPAKSVRSDKRRFRLEMNYCAGCEVRLNHTHSYRFQTKAPTHDSHGESVDLCESCFKAKLRASGNLPRVYEVPCVACGKSIGGSARVGPHGVICHDCYDLTEEGEREIAEILAWWRDNDLDRRLPADSLFLTEEERRKLDVWRQGSA